VFPLTEKSHVTIFSQLKYLNWV